MKSTNGSGQNIELTHISGLMIASLYMYQQTNVRKYPKAARKVMNCIKLIINKLVLNASPGIYGKAKRLEFSPQYN
jgi:trehalose/maltose hydrolase-like predicted phosphorylase